MIHPHTADVWLVESQGGIDCPPGLAGAFADQAAAQAYADARNTGIDDTDTDWCSVYAVGLHATAPPVRVDWQVVLAEPAALPPGADIRPLRFVREPGHPDFDDDPGPVRVTRVEASPSRTYALIAGTDRDAVVQAALGLAAAQG